MLLLYARSMLWISARCCSGSSRCQGASWAHQLSKLPSSSCRNRVTPPSPAARWYVRWARRRPAERGAEGDGAIELVHVDHPLQDQIDTLSPHRGGNPSHDITR